MGRLRGARGGVPLTVWGGYWWEEREAVSFLSISDGLECGLVADTDGVLHMGLQRGVHCEYVGTKVEIGYRCYGGKGSG